MIQGQPKKLLEQVREVRWMREFNAFALLKLQKLPFSTVFV